MTEKKFVGYVDVTPKWVEIVDMLVDMAHNGTVEQVGLAHNELRRMAAAADGYVAVQAKIGETIKELGIIAKPQGGVHIKHAEPPVLGNQERSRGGA